MTAVVQRIGEFLGGSPLVTDRTGVILIHFNLFVYSLCYWIQSPVLPYLSSELGANAVSFGSLQTVMSVMALAGGAMMGRLTDTKGAKLTLVMSHIGSFLMYALMSQATTFPILFASRIPAFLQHAMLCAQAAISSLAPPEARSAAMGRLSLSYALGMVLGSPLGGNLALFVGYRGAALCAALLTLLVIVVDVIFLPDFKPSAIVKEDSKHEKMTESNKDSSSLDQVIAFFKVLISPRVLQLLVVIFPISVGIGSFRAMLSLAGKDSFGMESSDLGYFISFTAFVGLVTNVFFIKPVTRKLGDFYCVIVAAVIQAACYAGLGVVSSFNGLLVLTIPTTMASTLLYTLSSSLMSLAVDDGNVGTAISISHATRSVVGVIAPVTGGFMYDHSGFGGVGIFAAACCMITVVVTGLTRSNFQMMGSTKHSKIE